jgi:hypothetical protein
LGISCVSSCSFVVAPACAFSSRNRVPRHWKRWVAFGSGTLFLITCAGGAIIFSQGRFTAPPVILILPAATAGAGLLVTYRLPSQRLNIEQLQQLLLPVLTVCAIIAGYAVRDASMFVSYYLDIIPFVSVIGGITVAELWRSAPTPRHNMWMKMGAVVFAIAIPIGTIAALPFLPAREVLGSPGDRINTVQEVQDVGDDLRERTAKEERVFSYQPLYLIDARRRSAADLSRKAYLTSDPDGEVRNRVFARLTTKMRTGEVQYAIYGPRTPAFLKRSENLKQVFENCYQPLETPIYDQINATLYKHNVSHNNCGREH